MADDLSGFSMLDLFCMEADTQVQVLESGLVELERDATPAAVEPLMRAAHSLKGAARIVGLDLVVGLAHAMEDALSAAMEGQLRLTSQDIDLLLKGTDVIGRLGRAGTGEIPGLCAGLAPRIGELNTALSGLKNRPAGETPQVPAPPAVPESEPEPSPMPTPDGTALSAAAPVPVAAEAQPPVPVYFSAPTQTPTAFSVPSPSAGQTPAAGPAPSDGFVRVSASNMSRVLGLSGECLVQTRDLVPLARELEEIKTAQARLSSLVEELLSSCRFCPRGGSGAAMIESVLSGVESVSERIARAAGGLDSRSRQLEALADRLFTELSSSRMRPFSEGVRGFPRMVRDMARSLGKDVEFTIRGNEVEVDRDILEKLESPLTHLLRNALDHGLETPEERLEAGKPARGRLVLEARHYAGALLIVVEDDGRGVDPDQVRQRILNRRLVAPEMAARLTSEEILEFLFLPGFSTAPSVTEISGRGVGLDVVRATLAATGGEVRVKSAPGVGAAFLLRLPISLAVARALIVRIDNDPYAFPLSRVDRVAVIPTSELSEVEGRQYATLDGEHVGLAPASQLFGLARSAESGPEIRAVLVREGDRRFGLVVDAFLGERDLPVKPLDKRLGKVRNVAAAAILEDGSPVLILDVDDLLRSLDELLDVNRPERIAPEADARVERKRVLVVDDSLTVREVERRLLENAGYAVDTAVDGMDGLHAAQSGQYALIVTDVDMPRMTGIDLIRKLKDDPRLKGVPVMIVSYKDREEDRRLGLEVGADYYFAKSGFHDASLLDAVADLIGVA